MELKQLKDIVIETLKQGETFRENEKIPHAPFGEMDIVNQHERHGDFFGHRFGIRADFRLHAPRIQRP